MQRVEPEQVVQLLLPRFDEDDVAAREAQKRELAKGVNASPGAAVGKAIFDADRAEEAGKAGEDDHPGAPGDQPRRRTMAWWWRRASSRARAAPAATRRSWRAAWACQRSSAAKASAWIYERRQFEVKAAGRGGPRGRRHLH